MDEEWCFRKGVRDDTKAVISLCPGLGLALFYRESAKLHRVGGPAVENVNGDRMWYENGKIHRVEGPALEYVKGTRVWYKNGKVHRVE